jgi:hypothetical protein
MVDYAIQTDQLSLIDGVRQASSNLVTVIEPQKRTGRQESLCLVVEAQRGASRDATVARLVARTVEKTFYQDHASFSITSSLRAAIRAANRALYHHNLNIPTPERSRVGVTCAVIHGGDIFIAQVTPSQMYVLTEGRIRALPEHPSPNLAPPPTNPSSRSSMLGSSLFVEPDLYRCLLRSSETFVICSSNLAPLLSRDEVAGVLEQRDSPAAVETLSAMCHQQDIPSAHALAVTVNLPPRTRAGTGRCPAPAASSPSPSPLLSPAPSASLPPIGNWLAGLNGAAVVSSAGGWLPGQAGAPAGGRPAGVETETPEQKTVPLPAMPPALPEIPRTAPTHPHSPVQGAGLACREDGDGVEMPGGQKAIDLGDAPFLAASAHPYRPRHQVRPLWDMRWYELLMLPFQSAGVALADGFGRTRIHRSGDFPRTAPRRRGYSPVPERERPPFSWFQLIALVLLVALLLLHGTHLSHQRNRQRDLEYLEQARHHLAEVQNAPDEQAALVSLDRAGRAIRRVRANPQVTPANPALWLPFQDIEYDYEQAMMMLHRLSYFEQPVLFAQHPLPNGHFDSVVIPPASTGVTDTTALEALAYGYALDIRSVPPRLYRIPREGGEPDVFLEAGDIVQAAEVGSLRSQAWSGDAIVVVGEQEGSYRSYTHKGATWEATALGGSDRWNPMGRLDMEGYDRNLYFWGAEMGEIVKFLDGHYHAAPSLWFDAGSLDPTDLDMAVDMAVDGNIYLLHASGHVLVFTTGQLARRVEPDALVPPIQTVTRLRVTGPSDGGWVFLLDRPNERIIQMDKQDGRVIQQIRMPPDSPLRLDRLTDFSVDVSSEPPMLYLVNGGQIVRAALPVPPPPFAPTTEAWGERQGP